MPLMTDPELLKKMLLPNVQIIAENLPQGWEEAVKCCWEFGAKIKTQYDRPDDPASRDVALNLTILNPFAEPRIHRDMPGGFEALEMYRREVLDGVHDSWIDPEAGKWQYTYHERIYNYTVPGIPDPINQIEAVINQLCSATHSGRAQAVIWKPWEDASIDDPACLQSLWFRILDDKLVMRCRMRINDAWKAAFMNMYVFTDLQRNVAEEISRRLDRKIEVGQYDHVADSFHIYGSYFKDFTGRFLQNLETRTFEQRTFRTNDSQIANIMEDASETVKAKLAHEREEYLKK